MKIVKLRLLTAICAQVCVSDEKGRFEPVIFSEASPVLPLEEDHARFILEESPHAHVFEIDESEDEDSRLEAARTRYEELTGKPASFRLKLPGLLALIEQAEQLKADEADAKKAQKQVNKKAAEADESKTANTETQNTGDGESDQ